MRAIQVGALLGFAVILGACATAPPSNSDPADQSDFATTSQGQLGSRTPTAAQDFSTGLGAWPSEAEDIVVSTEAGYVLDGRGAVVSPWGIEPATRDVALEAVLTVEDGDAGLFCRGDGTARTSYRLIASRDDGIQLTRHDRGSVTILSEEAIPIDPEGADQPIILRLFCSDTHEDGTIQLGWSLDASPVETTTDLQPLDTLATSSVGILVDGRASFQTVALLLVDETSEGS